VILEPDGPWTTGVLSGNIFHFAAGDHVRVECGGHHCVLTVTGNSFRGWGRVNQTLPDAAAVRVSNEQVLVHCSGNTFRDVLPNCAGYGCGPYGQGAYGEPPPNY
jgi:hypothetical protein